MYARMRKVMVIMERSKKHTVFLAYLVKVGKEASFGNGTLELLGLTNQTICAGILKILIKMASGAILQQITLNFRCAKLGIAQTVILVTYCQNPT